MGSIDLRLADTEKDAVGQLRFTEQRIGSAVLLSVDGTVDARNVAMWRRLTEQAARTTWAPGPLIVDVGDLEFMGCCAFTVLAEESARCRQRGVKVCLVSKQSITARVLAAGGLQAKLPLYPNVTAALAEHLAALDGRDAHELWRGRLSQTEPDRALPIDSVATEVCASDKNSGLEAGVEGVVEASKAGPRNSQVQRPVTDSLIPAGRAAPATSTSRSATRRHGKSSRDRKARVNASAYEARQHADQ